MLSSISLEPSSPYIFFRNFSMRTLARFICLTLFILLFNPTGAESADFQKGLGAYHRGNYGMALREWRPLAEQGSISAQTRLGIMYELGLGVSKNNKIALKWYALAAAQGYADAQYYLGMMYQEGQGVSQNYKIAVQWYTLAAEQGNVDAQTSLGMMYELGQGVSQNHKIAARWYTRAAKQGIPAAQYALGVLYALGSGVPRDDVYAYMWANISDANGIEEGGLLRDELSEKMTPAQVTKAQNMSDACVKKNFKGC